MSDYKQPDRRDALPAIFAQPGSKGQVQFGKPAGAILRDKRGADHVKKDMPLGGGVRPVHIPRLDAKPLEGGGTMEQQAKVLTDPTSPLSPAYNPVLAMERKGQHMKGPFEPLPEEATQDPRFRQGIGSRVAGNQPQMAPDGDYKPPISKESMDTLKEFARKAEEAQAAEVMPTKASMPKKSFEEQQGEEVERQISGTSRDLEDEIKSLLGDDDSFDHLNNPVRRKEIEARLEPLDLTDLIIQGELRQIVPIIPGKLEVELRSPSSEEDLAVKRLMYDEKGGDRYLMDKYIIMNLTLALVSINGQELPTHLKDGSFDETSYMRKFARVRKFPIQLVGDLGLQYAWFDRRVRMLLSNQTEEIKKS